MMFSSTAAFVVNLTCVCCVGRRQERQAQPPRLLAERVQPHALARVDVKGAHHLRPAAADAAATGGCTDSMGHSSLRSPGTSTEWQWVKISRLKSKVWYMIPQSNPLVASHCPAYRHMVACRKPAWPQRRPASTWHARRPATTPPCCCTAIGRR